jgi:hypothetical protein
MLPNEVTKTDAKPEPEPGLAPDEAKVTKPTEPIEAEVTLSGQAPTKVTVTPVDMAPDGKEATVKVSVSEGEPAEQAPNLAPLLLVAAAAVLVLVASSRGAAPSASASQ